MSGRDGGTTRRKLLVVSGAATASAACSTLPTGESPSTDSSVLDAPDTWWPPDDPYLDLDGGVPQVQPGAWRPFGTDVGSVASHPVGAFRYNAGVRAIIARDARGFYAYTALCPHERCVVGAPDAMGVTECPCHGSRFDGQGHVTEGPAVSALRRYGVRVASGRIYVDVTTRPADDVRTPPDEPDAGVRDASTDARPADAPADSNPVDTGPRDSGPADTGNPCDGTDAGPVTMFRAGTWTRLSAQRLVVARDTRGLYAYSARCTHSGCVINAPDDTGVATCGCHGSQFDGSGQVLRGPAGDPLEHYAVAVCAGRVIVRVGEVVADSTRTAVP